MKETKEAWKSFGIFHLACLAAGICLRLELALKAMLPFRIPTCLMREWFHLYCPFCGGSRLLLHLFRGEIGEAFRANPAVFIGGILLAAGDIIWFFSLLRGKSCLTPRVTKRVTVFFVTWFGVFFLVRNICLVCGIDRLGDLSSYWIS